MQRGMAILLALSFFMSGCSTSNTKSTGTTGSVTGNWQVTLTDSGLTNTPISQSGSLLQNEQAVSGNMLFTDSGCSGVGGVQGSVTGESVYLIVNPTGSQITLSGTLGKASDTSCTGTETCMGGTYTTVSTGCTDGKTVPSTGTWMATLVAPLSGSITGTLNSNSGAAYSVTGQVTQGKNTGSSSTPLSGTLTFGGGFCYTSANIVGSISGTAVVMNLSDSEGTQIGQISGTSSVDGSSVGTATFDYVGLGDGARRGCANGGVFRDVTFSIAASAS
jgi:hypothetical protein